MSRFRNTYQKYTNLTPQFDDTMHYNTNENVSVARQRKYTILCRYIYPSVIKYYRGQYTGKSYSDSTRGQFASKINAAKFKHEILPMNFQ